MYSQKKTLFILDRKDYAFLFNKTLNNYFLKYYLYYTWDKTKLYFKNGYKYKYKYLKWENKDI